jgi:hypothetical protein
MENNLFQILANNFSLGQVLAMGVMFWFFYDRLDGKINKLEEKFDKKITALEERINKLEEKLNIKITVLEEKVDKVREQLDMKISTLYMMLFKTSIDDVVCKPKTKKTK